MQETGSYSSAMARACVSGPFAKKAYSPNTRASALPVLDRAERPSAAGCGKCAATLIDHGTAGGWPGLRFWFPLRLHDCGYPVLAFFARAGRDAVDTTCVRPIVRIFQLPPFAKCAKDGAPPALVCQRDQKPGPRPSTDTIAWPCWSAAGARP